MGNESVVIEGSTYRVGTMTEDGFTVVEPRLGFVNSRLLGQVIKVSELIEPAISERPEWKKLKSTFPEDQNLGTMVRVVAIKDSEHGGRSYQCLCFCGDKEEVLTLSDRFVKECMSEE